MTSLVPLAMFGWPFLAVVLFATLPARRAILVGALAAWLFLPYYAYKIPLAPQYNKLNATCAVLILGVIVFDVRRAMTFRPRWTDLPILVLCLSPFLSSISNDLGPYDGLSAVAESVLMWGVPYIIGRLYFNDAAGMGDLATAIFAGALVYVPLCLFEIRMSPQLHYLFYGYHQHEWAQTLRFGGYRPMVFMQHGLMVGMWLTAGSLIGIWLATTKHLKSIWGMPAWPAVGVVVLTCVLAKSVGALVLLVVGCCSLFISKRSGRVLALACVLAIAPVYVTCRLISPSPHASAVELAEAVAGKDRAQSLDYRLSAEEGLRDRAMEQPLFGWGRWGRARLTADDGRDLVATDGLWILTLGSSGLVGLTALFCTLLIPPAKLLARFRMSELSHPQLAPAAALAVVLMLYAIDSLMNAMINPIYMFAAGGLAAYRPITSAGQLIAVAPHFRAQHGQRFRLLRKSAARGAGRLRVKSSVTDTHNTRKLP